MPECPDSPIVLPFNPDSIDLQDRDAPTAQGHSKPAAHGSLAPHQAETLREVAAETAEEHLRSPRVSWANGDANDLQKYADELSAGVANSLNSSGGTDEMQAEPQEDTLAIAQNGGLSGQEVDDSDIEGGNDVDMDDDMMDKISSSPSIEDGGSFSALPSARPHSADLLCESGSPGCSLASRMLSDARSSSPYLNHPEQSLPIAQDRQPDVSSTGISCRHHHLCGELNGQRLAEGSILRNVCARADIDNGNCDLAANTEQVCMVDGLIKEQRAKDCERSRLVAAQSVNSAGCGTQLSYSASGLEEDADSTKTDGNCNDIHDDDESIIPYETDDQDDDDDGDCSSVDDARFLDSGWGGECLQNPEDIDFEFVYALHTFVATVEGQANATKGDTMVLLDDSNSYWWLVRVVKDSSIGRYLEGVLPEE